MCMFVHINKKNNNSRINDLKATHKILFRCCSFFPSVEVLIGMNCLKEQGLLVG